MKKESVGVVQTKYYNIEEPIEKAVRLRLLIYK
jgi:hypothetical protein